MPLILGGRYLPIKLLGKGGFGAAFLAVDRYTPTMRLCVVKQFQPEGNLGPRELELAQQLFEREALVLEQLGNKHRQIPDLFAFFPLLVPPGQKNNQEEQYFYLVQEFIDGQDLETELEQKGKFSESEVTEVLTEILNILKFVHENNSIHRDIKPSNIMRDRQGVLYLLDFGAVKLVTTGGATNPQTKSTGIYSMGFAPPEQMTGGQVYPSTDLYALAVTCLNLLTGKQSGELFNAYHNQWQWHQYAPKVSDRLAQTLDKMLLPSPKDRFQSAGEVLAALSQPPTPPISQPSVPCTAVQTSARAQPTPPPVVQPPSPPPQPQPQPKLKRQRPPRPQPKPLPLFPILSGAGFAGFEAVLLGIALTSALPALSFNVMIGIWGGCVGLLIFALLSRTIEKLDLIIIGGISLGLVWYLPILHSFLEEAYQLPLMFVIILPVLAGVASITVTTLFLLIYKFIRGIF
jgi:serine/threonine-protein kinase